MTAGSSLVTRQKYNARRDEERDAELLQFMRVQPVWLLRAPSGHDEQIIRISAFQRPLLNLPSSLSTRSLISTSDTDSLVGTMPVLIGDKWKGMPEWATV